MSQGVGLPVQERAELRSQTGPPGEEAVERVGKRRAPVSDRRNPARFGTAEGEQDAAAAESGERPEPRQREPIGGAEREPGAVGGAMTIPFGENPPQDEAGESERDASSEPDQKR